MGEPTGDDLAELRRLHEAATPGPWRTHDTWLDHGGHTAVVFRGEPPEAGGAVRVTWLPSFETSWGTERNVWNDADLIAAMRNALPGLLAEVERHRGSQSGRSPGVVLYGEDGFNEGTPVITDAEVERLRATAPASEDGHHEDCECLVCDPEPHPEVANAFGGYELESWWRRHPAGAPPPIPAPTYDQLVGQMLAAFEPGEPWTIEQVKDAARTVMALWPTEPMLASTRFQPDWAVHPGEILCEELEERGMTQAQLAETLGHADASQVSRLCNGRASVNVQTAVRLERALGPSAELWLRLQMAYDLHHARKEATDG